MPSWEAEKAFALSAPGARPQQIPRQHDCLAMSGIWLASNFMRAEAGTPSWPDQRSW